jgi:O-antigen chain-terminating methyltransferase
VLIERCQKQGLEVAEKDVVQDLAALPADTLGAVTAFHLIEHLPFNLLMRFVDETVRVLKPGGLIIFETPNPENVRVGSYSFYFDPTHINPLPSTVTKFLIESKGFFRVKVLPLNPVDEEEEVKGDDSELARRFNKLFYGPRDYAVIGYKV